MRDALALCDEHSSLDALQGSLQDGRHRSWKPTHRTSLEEIWEWKSEDWRQKLAGGYELKWRVSGDYIEKLLDGVTCCSSVRMHLFFKNIFLKNSRDTFFNYLTTLYLYLFKKLLQKYFSKNILTIQWWNIVYVMN